MSYANELGDVDELGERERHSEFRVPTDAVTWRYTHHIEQL